MVRQGLGDGAVKLFGVMERFINLLIHKYKHIKVEVKVKAINAHDWCKDNLVYRKAGYELSTILLNGFFIWIALFPFVQSNPVWFIPCYGIIPWFLIAFKKEWVAK